MLIILEELETDSHIEDLYYELQNYLDEQNLPIQYKQTIFIKLIYTFKIFKSVD